MGASTKAKSAFAGDKLYQRRGRAAFPILVRQAIAEQPLAYEDLAAELEMPNPRNTDFVLGSVARALVILSEEWGEDIPRLTSIVVDKYTRLPANGIAEFLRDPEAYLNATLEQRTRIADRLFFEVYAYRGWDRVLRHFGLATAPARDPPSSPPRGGGTGEGPDHLALKAFVAAHPEAVGLPRSAVVETEAHLPSGDRVDVLFSVRRRDIAIEVKAHTASEQDIERGLYQCVKYEALLKARQRARHEPIAAGAVLVLGGALPRSLLPLKHALGVHVKEWIGTGNSGGADAA